MAIGSAEPDVRRALEDINGDETLAIKMLCFEECARVGNDTNKKVEFESLSSSSSLGLSFNSLHAMFLQAYLVDDIAFSA